MLPHPSFSEVSYVGRVGALVLFSGWIGKYLYRLRSDAGDFVLLKEWEPRWLSL